MGKVTLNLSEAAESWLRGKNRKKGDMSVYASAAILEKAEREKQGGSKQ